VKNGIGGTLDQPCANAAGWQFYCNSSDVQAWAAVAWELFTRVRTAWNDTARTGFQIPQSVTDYVTALEKDYCEPGPDGQCAVYKLPQGNWYDVAENAAAAAAHARWCSRAACALELLDNVRGTKPPIETTPEHVPWLPDLPSLGGGALPMLALAALALWLISRRR